MLTDGGRGGGGGAAVWVVEIFGSEDFSGVGVCGSLRSFSLLLKLEKNECLCDGDSCQLFIPIESSHRASRGTPVNL